MCAGLSLGRSCSDDPNIEDQIRRGDGGDGVALQANGLLLEGGSLLRRKGRHDRICQTQDSRAGRKLQPPWLYS